MNLQLIYVVGAYVGICEFCTRCRCVVQNRTTHLQVKLVWRLYGVCTEIVQRLYRTCMLNNFATRYSTFCLVFSLSRYYFLIEVEGISFFLLFFPQTKK